MSGRLSESSGQWGCDQTRGPEATSRRDARGTEAGVHGARPPHPRLCPRRPAQCPVGPQTRGDTDGSPPDVRVKGYYSRNWESEGRKILHPADSGHWFQFGLHFIWENKETRRKRTRGKFTLRTERNRPRVLRAQGRRGRVTVEVWPPGSAGRRLDLRGPSSHTRMRREEWGQV